MKDTFLFDFKKCDFVMDGGSPVVVKDVDALKVWIDKILHTQLNRYKIYSGTNYGANIEDLFIGKSYGFGFASSELKREIEAALLQNADIYSVSDFEITKNKDMLNVSFKIKTVYGEEEYVYDG